MKTKQQPLVAREQAKRLKNAGFDWECDYHFHNGKLFKTNPPLSNKDLSENQLYAPTVAHALKWMRKEKGIYYCHVAPEVYCDGWVFVFGFNARDMQTNHESYPLYEAAESAMLDAILDAMLNSQKE
jgi:hypothetical protein